MKEWKGQQILRKSVLEPQKPNFDVISNQIVSTHSVFWLKWWHMPSVLDNALKPMINLPSDWHIRSDKI